MAANFSREDLQDIRATAEALVGNRYVNAQERIAYLDLASAADRVDAMLARTTLDAQAPSSGAWPTGSVPVVEESD